jgi:hypothetical protein
MNFHRKFENHHFEFFPFPPTPVFVDRKHDDEITGENRGSDSIKSFINQNLIKTLLYDNNLATLRSLDDAFAKYSMEKINY